MAATEAAYEILVKNGTVIKAGTKAWESTVGIFFWPILFLWTLVVVYIKTENPAYIFMYAVLGNALLAWKAMTQLDTIFHPVFYVTAVISLFLVLWKIFGSNRI